VAEAVHDGAVAAVDAGATVVASYGDVHRRFLARSAVKPFQLRISEELGGELPPEYLAVASSSHGGDPVHIAIVHAILSDAGLSEDDLQCPPTWPLSAPAMQRLIAAGHRRPRRIWHNCSGKHAAMLRACAVQGWPTATYRDPDHPLQQRIAAYVAAVTGEDPRPAGVDGCGAPAFQVSTIGLARACARFAVDPALRHIWVAMHRFPALASDTTGTDAHIATWLDAAAKRGAEAALGVAVRDRMGIAAKAWDGAVRGVSVGMLAALGELGLISGYAAVGLAADARPAVLGSGEPVGRVEPAIRFA
jgi:L-asparaginase II